MRDLRNVLDSLTGSGRFNMDLDVLVRTGTEDGDVIICSTIAFSVETGRDSQDTMFIDVDEDEENNRQRDTVPDVIPQNRHLTVVK